jgi:hypothetical protein
MDTIEMIASEGEAKIDETTEIGDTATTVVSESVAIIDAIPETEETPVVICSERELVEVGGIWVSEYGTKPALLGIKIKRKSYVAFKNARKIESYDPDYYIFEHQNAANPPLSSVGVVWKLFNRDKVQLSIKIDEDYYYALERSEDDPSQRSGFVVVARRLKQPESDTDVDDNSAALSMNASELTQVVDQVPVAECVSDNPPQHYDKLMRILNQNYGAGKTETG